MDLYIYGPYNYGVHNGLNSYGLCSYDVYGYGLRSCGLYMADIVMVDIVMVYTIGQVSGGIPDAVHRSHGLYSYCVDSYEPDDVVSTYMSWPSWLSVYAVKSVATRAGGGVSGSGWVSKITRSAARKESKSTASCAANLYTAGII